MAQADGYTYGGDPQNSELDQVRLLIGDTDCPGKLLDKEIQFYIAEEGSPLAAAVRAAEAISAKFCMKVDITTGKVRKNLSQIAESYAALAKRLQSRLDELSGAPVFTALRESDKRLDQQDPDLVQPNFRIGQDDNPRKVAAQNVVVDILGQPL